MSKVQTENSYFSLKIKLRELFTPDNSKVLDCYSANGSIWNEIAKRKHISVLRLEKEKGRDGIYLRDDNLKFLKNMDLTQFDVIDLDAFGVPFKQLEIIFEKELKNKIVFITFIQSVFGALPRKMLNTLGYTDSMIDKIPSLFNTNGFEKLKAYLSQKNIDEVKYFNVKNKYYAYIYTGEKLTNTNKRGEKL